ncbi:hypothetical protein HWV62_28098 [Athelia sp. TMB]|nr:hypothetical protein HWV62_28098 [Athelia sp. TMB]
MYTLNIISFLAAAFVVRSAAVLAAGNTCILSGSGSEITGVCTLSNATSVSLSGNNYNSVSPWKSSNATLTFTTLPAGSNNYGSDGSSIIGATNIVFNGDAGGWSIKGSLDTNLANQTTVTGSITFNKNASNTTTSGVPASTTSRLPTSTTSSKVVGASSVA